MFDNGSAHAEEQHRCLAELLDPVSLARLAGTDVGPGWRCLDIGTGGGSVARWLAGRVGPGGEVVATDIKPRPAPPVPGLRVWRHDAVRDPLPAGAFDLVHARLVLQHLPERDRVLPGLVGALRPGGTLVIDEWDIGYGPALTGGPAQRELYDGFRADKDRVFRAAGGDPTWGRRVVAGMAGAGLVDIDPVPHAEVWRGGSPGARLQKHHTYHAEAGFRRLGWTDRRLADIRALLDDPAFWFTAPVRYWVAGRRAG